MELPELAEKAKDLFPADVIARAKVLQEEIGSIGAYSHSQGVPYIRQQVAKFIGGMLPLWFSKYLPLIYVQNAMGILPIPITSSSLAELRLVFTTSSPCSSPHPAAAS
jgi:hypothetical protein